MLKNCPLKDGFDLAEAFRQQVHGEPIEFDGGEIPVSISLGLTYCGSKSEADLDKLLRQADEALYEAKRGGRNCTKVWTGARLLRQGGK